MPKIAEKWTLIISFLVHIVFLVSIFDIYFKSPVILGQKPVLNNVPALAKRLILFVGDGLRADSFFQIHSNGEMLSPYLRRKIEERGRWGISHAAVPTESRPGHVALIAGFYEDPSAIFKGWKDNPVEFDSVFNRSSVTFGWGSPDILSMFNKESSNTNLFMNAYPAEFQEFSGTNGSAARLSLWAFENFKQFLYNAKFNQSLREMLNQDKIIFFLHLLGIDTAGHSHKPYSDVYKDNIKLADKIVKDVESLISEFYNYDNQSVFIFTSDHGMTDWGSHGEGSKSETELPYVAWGSGISTPTHASKLHSPANWNLNHFERNDINQVDVAPLMSVLLGLSIPVNSVGMLPVEILKCSASNKSSALLLNARQILAQFVQKRKIIENSTLKFLYKPFEELSNGKDFIILRTLESQLRNENFDLVLKGSKNFISLCSAGLSYYHNYYQKPLLVCISSSYIGWICWLLMNIFSSTVSTAKKSQKSWSNRRNRLFVLNCLFVVLIVAFFILLMVQFLPLQYYLYCCMPLIIWWNVFRRLGISSFDYNRFYSCLFILVATVIAVELVVISFFERRTISVITFFIMFWPVLLIKKKISRLLFLLLWISSCVSLIMFPFLPVIGGKPNNTFLLVRSLLFN